MQLPFSFSSPLSAILGAVAICATAAWCQPEPIPVTIRDFNSSHPDFEDVKGTCAVEGRGVKGMVQKTLDSARKPVQSPDSPCPNYNIGSWFRDNPAVNKRYCMDLPLEVVPGRVNTFKTPAAFAASYFPIDQVPISPTSPKTLIKAPDPVNPGQSGETFDNHNFHFCMEMHATFKYRGGEVFDFKGDDDVWVFINNRLALDLGGTQYDTTGQVNLDAQRVDLGIAPDNYYNFDFFFCERQTKDSQMEITTSIDIIPPPAPGIHIADENGGMLTSGDTVKMDPSAANRIFKGVKIEIKPLTVDCNNLTTQVTSSVSGNWTFTGGAIPAGNQASISAGGLAPGIYKLVLERDGFRDSIWVNVAPLPQAKTPVATPAGQAFRGSLPVSLASSTLGASIHFTIDGTLPTASSPLYTPETLTLSGNTTLKAVAVMTGFRTSEVMTEVYTKIMAKALAGWYLDKDGDGRIETAVIRFDSNISVPPKAITFTDPFARANPLAPVAQAAGPGGTIIYTLPPFAAGTGFAAEALAAIVAELEFATQTVVMSDSVGPVAKVVKSFPVAAIQGTGADRAASVEIEFSEPVPLDPASLVFPLEIKRGVGLVVDAEVKVASVETLSPARYRFTFAPNSKYPVLGDSARLPTARPVMDAAGNRSDMRYFVPVTGEPARADADLNVRLTDPITRSSQVVILRAISNPVVVHGDRTCVNCGALGSVLPTQEPVKLGGLGPTWNVKTKFPFTYSMAFYDNLGQFVNRAQGEVSPQDFEKLRLTETVGDSVLVQLTFLPVAHDGRALGTGAYIMRGVMRIHDQTGIKGSQGETITLVPTERTLVSRFGYVREP